MKERLGIWERDKVQGNRLRKYEPRISKWAKFKSKLWCIIFHPYAIMFIMLLLTGVDFPSQY